MRKQKAEREDLGEKRKRRENLKGRERGEKTSERRERGEKTSEKNLENLRKKTSRDSEFSMVVNGAPRTHAFEGLFASGVGAQRTL